VTGPWRRHRARAHNAGGVAVSLAFFGVSLVASLLAHGDTPAARRFVAHVASRLLSSIFEGRFELEGVGHVGFNGVDVGRVRIYDPSGQVVIEGRGLKARTFVPDILRRVLGGGPLVIDIPTIRLEEADVLLKPERRAEGGGATVSLESTFRPRESGAPEPEPEVGTLPRVVVVNMPSIELGHAKARGEPTAGLPLEADVFQARASLSAGNRGVVLDVARSAIKGRFVDPLNPHGTAEYHLRVPEPDDATPVSMWASFDGELGAVPVAATAWLAGGRLEGRLDVARATPAEAHSLLPGLPVTTDLAGHFEVSGDLPELGFAGEVAVGPGRLRAHGEGSFGSPITIEAQVEARGLDARSFFAEAPPFALGADLTARFRLEDGVPTLVLQGATLPATFEGQAVPPVAARARLEGGRWRVDARVEERGLPLAVDLRVDPEGEVTFEATGRTNDLRAVPRLGGEIGGAATVHAQGRAGRQGLDVAVDARLSGFRAPGVELGRASVTGKISGPFAAPQASLALSGEGATVASLPVARVEARAGGSLRSSHVAVRLVDPRWDELALEADMGLAPEVSFRKVRAGLRRGELRADGAVDAVEALPGGGFALRRVKLESTAGAASADVLLRPSDVDLEAHGTVRLAQLAALLPGLPMTGGEAAVMVSVHGDARGRRSGRASVSVADAEIAKLPLRGRAELNATFEGDKVALAYKAGVKPSGGQDVVALEGGGEGTLRGSLLEPSTYARAVGRLDVRRATLRFDRAHNDPTVRALLAGSPALSALVRGTTIATLSLERDRPDVWPSLTAALATQRLTVALPHREGREHGSGGPEPGRRLLQGLDVLATMSVRHEGEGAKARTSVEAAVRAADQRAALAFAEAKTQAPTEELAAHLGAIFGDEARARQALAKLAGLPLEGRLSWVDRPFEDWPAAIRLKGLKGKVGADVALSGKVGDPDLDVEVRLERVATQPEQGEPWYVDGRLAGRLEHDRSEVWGRIFHDGAEVLELGARADVGPGSLLWGDAPNWTGGGLVVVRGLELESVPQLAALGVGGRLSGTFAVEDLHARPNVNFDFTLLRGKVLGGEFPNGTLRGRLTAGGGSFITATLRQGSSQASPEGGLFEATALASFAFKDGLWPALDPSQPQAFGVRLRQFDVAPFAPLAEPVFADLGGLLSGETTLTLRAPSGPGASGGPATSLEGQLYWRQGVLLVPQVGQTFRQGRFDLRAETAGDAIKLHLVNLAIGATSGTIEGGGEFEVPARSLRAGVLGDRTPEGLDWATGRASLSIREAQKIPVTFEGVPLGNAFGAVDAWAQVRPEGTNVSVALPSVTLELPEGATREVQELGEAADVGVVDRRNRRRKIVREEDAYPFTIAFGLGESLNSLAGKPGTVAARGVHIERAGTDVRVRGRPVVELTDEVRMRGSVEATYGRFTLLGKPFAVDLLSVRWGEGGEADPASNEGQPSNPFVSLRARWDGTDGSHVYAEADDYLNDLNIRLRSDPPRSDAGVRALLLYGRDPTNSASTLSPGLGLSRRRDAANDAAISGVSTVLNSLLDLELFGRRIETRTGTGHAGDSRFGLATEVRPNLWFTFDISTLSSQQADRLSSTDRTAGTLDWRFRPRWSLRTTVGYGSRYGGLNAGPSTSLDLIWQYRY
jgi:translocation and assembly module TamB